MKHWREEKPRYQIGEHYGKVNCIFSGDISWFNVQDKNLDFAWAENSLSGLKKQCLKFKEPRFLWESRCWKESKIHSQSSKTFAKLWTCELVHEECWETKQKVSIVYGHTFLNAPHLVWSQKLSRVGPA